MRAYVREHTALARTENVGPRGARGPAPRRRRARARSSRAGPPPFRRSVTPIAHEGAEHRVPSFALHGYEESLPQCVGTP